MAFRTRVKCVIILLLVTCTGRSYAELFIIPNLSYNEMNQNETEVNIEDAKTVEDTSGLESVLGRDWESENKPLSEDELNSFYKKLFGSNDITESNIYADSKPNKPEDIQTVPNSQFDEKAKNNGNNKKDVIQNSKAPKEDSQQAIFSSSDTPYLHGTNNVGSTLSTLQPKIEVGIYATTPSDGPENINPYTVWPSILDDDIPTSPKYQKEPNQTLDPQTVTHNFSSDFLPDSQSGVLPTGSTTRTDIYTTTTTPSNWYGSQENILKPDIIDEDNATNPNPKSDTHDEEHPTTPNFVPENQPEVKSNVPNLISINQSGIDVSSDLNPNIPKYNPNVLIRPGLVYRYHRPYFRPSGRNFGHGGHIYTKHRCGHNHWFGRHRHHFHREYTSPHRFNLFNSQSNYRQHGHPKFKLQPPKHFNPGHVYGHHIYHSGFHGNYRNQIRYR